MKESYLKVALAVCIVAILVLVGVNYVDLDKKDNNRYPVNEGLTSVFDFEADAPEVGTSAKGTFFVMQNKDSLKIKIVAEIEVGETDIGGVEFGTRYEGLDLVSVLCSYRDEMSNEYITTYGGSRGNFVEIARSTPYSMGIASGGGSGWVIIEFKLNGSADLSGMDTLDFFVVVGGSKNVMGLDVDRIYIPIAHDL